MGGYLGDIEAHLALTIRCSLHILAPFGIHVRNCLGQRSYRKVLESRSWRNALAYNLFVTFGYLVCGLSVISGVQLVILNSVWACLYAVLCIFSRLSGIYFGKLLDRNSDRKVAETMFSISAAVCNFSVTAGCLFCCLLVTSELAVVTLNGQICENTEPCSCSQYLRRIAAARRAARRF